MPSLHTHHQLLGSINRCCLCLLNGRLQVLEGQGDVLLRPDELLMQQLHPMLADLFSFCQHATAVVTETQQVPHIRYAVVLSNQVLQHLKPAATASATNLLQDLPCQPLLTEGTVHTFMPTRHVTADVMCYAEAC